MHGNGHLDKLLCSRTDLKNRFGISSHRSGALCKCNFPLHFNSTVCYFMCRRLPLRNIHCSMPG